MRLYLAPMKDDPELKNKATDCNADPVALRLIATAYHEAGHAVMAQSLGRLVQKVTILPGKSQFGQARLGICEIRKGRSKASKDQLEDEALILLAGMVAEARFTGQYCQSGAAQDLRNLQRLLQHRANSEAQLESLQRKMLAKTEHLLHADGPSRAIELVACELLQKQTISGRAVRHFFEQAEKQSQN